MGACRITATDRSPMGKRAVPEWSSPLEPRERHQDRHRLGGGMGDWLLLTNEFIPWGESGDQPPSLPCSVGGITAMGDLRARCVLGIDCGCP